MLFSCGEVLTRQLLDSVKEAGAQKIFNLYGPTETAVYITGIDMTHRDKIVVGKAYQLQAVCWMENLKPVMPMARGELYIGGECLSRGYSQPAGSLRRNPSSAGSLFPGEIMYKSGDIVRDDAGPGRGTPSQAARICR